MTKKVPFSGEDSFREIGMQLDKELAATSNVVICDLAGMDAFIAIQDLLCDNAITSFTPSIGVSEYQCECSCQRQKDKDSEK